MINTALFVTLWAALILSLTQGQNCGPPQCYSPCTDARPWVDFVFLIDISGSMKPKISAVVGGLTTFAQNLNSNQIYPAFSLVTFGSGYDPDESLALQMTTNFESFKTAMNSLSTSGSIEPGLETLNRALNNAATGNFNIAYRTGANTKKVFIIVTNEDSDKPISSANLFSSTVGGVLYQENPNSNDDNCYQLNPLPKTYTAIDSNTWNYAWQLEVNSVANQLISNAASLYMFVGGQASVDSTDVFLGQTCNTPYQYCNPNIQSQNPTTYGNFNATQTLLNMAKNSSSNSLQGQLLRAGLTSRCFDVADTVSSNSNNLISNFFSQISSDVSKCDACYVYQCSGVTPTSNGTCLAPVKICDCAGVKYGTSLTDANGVCCLPSAMDCAGICHGSSKFDPCGICSVGGAPSASCVQDCANSYYLSSNTPPHHVDECHDCVPANMTRAATCIKDCAGVWGGTHFVDSCSYCVTAGTPVNGHKDFCGVCDGGNSTLNQCGVCNGNKALDNCGQPVCKNLACHKECDGISRNVTTLHIDECGDCISLNLTRSATCIQDCAGAYYTQGNVSSHHRDECGNCIPASLVRTPGCVQDCSGAWGGNATVDTCGQCVVHNVAPYPCVRDCHGLYYRQGIDQPAYEFDTCGICNNVTDKTTFNSKIDACGICTNKPGYDSLTDCTPDCKGIYSLTTNPNRAFTDDCHSCWFADQRNMTNYLMDNCGICFPSRNDSGWNTMTNGFDSQGQPCKCGTKPTPCQGSNETTCHDNCPINTYCPPDYLTLPDECGRCPNDTLYNKGRDQCGICCDPDKGIPCNQDLDSCGICFGFDQLRATNPCKICNSTMCHVDCNGTPNGTATYDCAGICGGNSVCAICGDGIINGAETCDLGHDDNGLSLNVPGSGCNNCQAENGGLHGSTIGIIIGAVLAFLLLILAVAAAAEYARRNGMFGKVKKSDAFTSSNVNDNPLYQPEVQVVDNRIYSPPVPANNA